MKIIKILINLFTIISVLVLILALIYIFQITIQKKEYGTLFGYSIFQIASGSMEPTINIGDRILMKESKDITEGDIVLYKNEDTLVCHRVEEIKDNNVICKGDNNNSKDKEISKNEIIGKIIHIF
ncbi:MAG: signal peptidase I [Clostridia bacterium]|nr:signal peptidase I [Clostridia bacterium]